jgi:predicted enzyme related to lactoylglutathione lyase
MLERDGYIEGVPCWADTTQPDPEAAAAFYSQLFGWELEDAMPADSQMKYFIARRRGGDIAAISSQSEDSPPMAMWNTYIWVDDADAATAKVKAAGGQVLMEPDDVFDAGRMAVFSDPEGAVFAVWQAKNHKGSNIVNEHGSVNFNTLSTRDPDGAKKFYGEVFGWTVLDLGGDGGAMWQVPGYIDHLETIDPGVKQRMKEMGAPDGFEDVVAAMSVLAPDDSDTPPHWGITFAVDDADAAAAKAQELGATVLVPPFDAPWVRMTIITDPQGATFVASQFVPENATLGQETESAGAAA